MRSERAQSRNQEAQVVTGSRGQGGRPIRGIRPGRSAFVALLASLLLLAVGVLAAGADFQLGSSQGKWTYVDISVTGLNTNAIYWGNSTGYGQSGFEFLGSTGASFNADEIFVIGTFIHHNKPITGSTPTSDDPRGQAPFYKPHRQSGPRIRLHPRVSRDSECATSRGLPLVAADIDAVR